MSWRTLALLAVLIGGVIVGVFGGVAWYETPHVAVEKDDSTIVVTTDGSPIDTLGSADTQAISTNETNGALLSVIHVPESSVQTTSLIVLWRLPVGFWYDAQLQIQPKTAESAWVSEPVTVQYEESRFVGDPTTQTTGSQTHVSFPLAFDHGRTDTQVHVVDDTANQTVPVKIELTARSLSGDTRAVSTTVEVVYTFEN